MKSCVLLAAHGTVQRLDELPDFLTVIRRGHAPPPELVEEVRRRYAAIGGQSPLLDTTRLVAAKLEAQIHVPTRVAMRLWNPRIADVVKACASEGFTRLVVLSLAQYSSHVYVGSVRDAVAALGDGTRPEVVDVGPWGSHAGLLAVYASRVQAAWASIPEAERGRTRLFFSAHSLPVAVIRGGDPYERDVRAAADTLRHMLREVHGLTMDSDVIFQSQGMSAGPGGKPMEWLGPDVRAALDRAARDGMARVLFAPIGFLADHVEILYDLDIEAAGWAQELGLAYQRTASPNADDDFVAALASVIAPHIA